MHAEPQQHPTKNNLQCAPLAYPRAVLMFHPSGADCNIRGYLTGTPFKAAPPAPDVFTFCH